MFVIFLRINMKKCRKCNIDKDESEFYKRKKSPDGLDSKCKTCVNDHRKNYNKAHSKDSSERSKKYYKKHREEHLQRMAENRNIPINILRRTLEDMKLRCYNPTHKAYKYYGGRGITVCDRWLDPDNGLNNFKDDMGFRPSPEYSIDRINNDGNYEPANCRWATIIEQNNNQRRRKSA